MQITFIQPQWPAPSHIKAYTTLRSGGFSESPFDQFNLAEHVGDHTTHVQANRELLKKQLKLPNDPIWIQQVHGTQVVQALPENKEQEADAVFSHEANQVCAILTADCLPILICNQKGTQVAAIHAGWRGLVNGVIESTLTAMQAKNENLLVWLGPAISPANFEVGNEVREQFIDKHAEAIHAFIPSPNQRWLADLYALARLRLLKQGVTAIYGGGFCTYADSKRFYSYRRDGKTGRMASLIWISDSYTVKC